MLGDIIKAFWGRQIAISSNDLKQTVQEDTNDERSGIDVGGVMGISLTAYSMAGDQRRLVDL
jgi:hypothetical protein